MYVNINTKLHEIPTFWAGAATKLASRSNTRTKKISFKKYVYCVLYVRKLANTSKKQYFLSSMHSPDIYRIK